MPRYFVVQERFSTRFRPLTMAHAHGCLTERTLGPEATFKLITLFDRAEFNIRFQNAKQVSAEGQVYFLALMAGAVRPCHGF